MEDPRDRPWIVVGVDGSPSARAALDWAADMAVLLGAGVAVVHATGLLEIGGGQGTPEARRAAIRATVEDDWCQPLAGRGLPLTIETPETAAVDAVTARSDALDACLIVVGTRGTAIAPERTIGSTTLHLLEALSHTNRPALVVPADAPAGSRRLQRLLVAVDGSDESHAALAWAAELAALTGGGCDVLAAAEEDPVFPLGPAATVTSEGEEKAVDRLHALVQQWSEPLATAGVLRGVLVERGPAAPTIVDGARRLDADLVVVGTSGTGSAGNPILGSVSRHVAHDAGRAVAVVPAGASLRRLRH